MSKPYIIAYIDDDPDDLELASHYFSTVEGLELLTFNHPADYTSFVLSNASQVCALMLDINMPIYNGVDLAQSLRQYPDLNHLPVVLFSTSSHTLRKVEDDWHFISKPSSVQEYEKVVQQIVSICE